MNIEKINRREILKYLGLAGLGIIAHPFTGIAGERKSAIRKRPIPSTKEMMPIVGLGTWLQFDVGERESERAPLKEVLRRMAKFGGKFIDTSPMYGRAEQVIGDLTTELNLEDEFFYATKVWTRGREAGIDQMNRSMKLMNREVMDLIQVHNLIDWKTHLKTLRRWKEEGKVRYIGITHYTVSSHDRLEQIIQSEPLDFVQVNYSIGVRNAEKSLLDTARKEGVAVVINRPFEGGSLFNLTKEKELPDWSQKYEINSWAQFFLKFILSHPAVSCAIPGTSDPDHLAENMQAGTGPLPDAQTRKKMVRFFENNL